MILRKLVTYYTFFFSITFSLAISSSPTKVDFKFNRQSLISIDFAHFPRLDKVVQQGLRRTGAEWEKVDWLASGLYDVNHQFTSKNQVISALAAHQELAERRSHNSWYYWYQLSEDLKTMNFAKKIFQSIDPDTTRLKRRSNPKLVGHWFISLKKNTKSILVLGNIRNSGQQPWQARQSAKYYAKMAKLVDPTVSKITVIQPDGRVEHHPSGYWNQTFSEIAPGAIVYVPIPAEKFPPFLNKVQRKNPNDLVVELLRNKLP
jgi:hypothetical protein